MPKINLALSYFISLIVLLLGGLTWVFLKYEPNSLRMLGLLFAVFICAIVNLTYFLSLFNLAMRLLVPGVMCIILFWMVNQNSSVERVFFTFFGVLNFLTGLSWFLFYKFKLKN